MNSLSIRSYCHTRINFLFSHCELYFWRKKYCFLFYFILFYRNALLAHTKMLMVLTLIFVLLVLLTFFHDVLNSFMCEVLWGVWLFIFWVSLWFPSNMYYWAFISQKDAHLLQVGWLFHHVPINAYPTNIGCQNAILLWRSFCIPSGDPGRLQFYCHAFWCLWVCY